MNLPDALKHLEAAGKAVQDAVTKAQDIESRVAGDANLDPIVADLKAMLTDAQTAFDECRKALADL